MVLPKVSDCYNRQILFCFWYVVYGWFIVRRFLIFSFAENLFSIYSTFAPLAGAGHLLLLFGKSRQKRSQGKLPENGNFPRHPRVGSITCFFYLSPLPLALGEARRASSRSLLSRRTLSAFVILFFIFYFFIFYLFCYLLFFYCL